MAQVDFQHEQAERRIISDPSELRALLQSTFLIRLPEGPQLDALLERLTRLP